MKVFFLLLFSLTVFMGKAQISDIKNKSKSNSYSHGSVNRYSSNTDTEDFATGCMMDALGCCFENGFLLLYRLLAENNRMSLQNRDADPTIVSADFMLNFALAWHYSSAKSYVYINYLPEIRVNLASFTTSFRYNILNEYTNGFPNSFSSWEFLFILNIQPSSNFKLSLGTGLQYEKYSDSYFNEHYIALRFRMRNEQNFLEFNNRLSIDYATNALPFVESGIHYKIQIAEFEHTFMYINIGGMYQNYYSSHDIWLAKSGLIVNWH